MFGLVKTPGSPTELAGLIASSSSWLQLPANCRPWEAAMEIITITWETGIAFLIPSCDLALVLVIIWRMNQQMGVLSVSF